ncbi:calcium and integrin-binding family member 2 [Harmonia axyridis]|uniref:calcium and integrin-binding family member 2 n=1 Tax=Harmonia axyridis TaxID=115357 RepID=UPI001E275C40|nr:calcium and integrin-binding family member 2 [Harmonia axyridis]
MGNKIVTFSEQQLHNYQDCTFFNEKEILRVFEKFRNIRPDLVPKKMKQYDTVNIRISVEDIVHKLPELQENPFNRRICEVFSRDGNGNLSFEDFLELLSVFCEHAPRDIKVYYAFRIYDFDGDNHIGPEDINEALNLLTRQELFAEERQQIAEKVMEEADVDGDGKLSFMEFEHVVTRAPEFLSTFHIRI